MQRAGDVLQRVLAKRGLKAEAEASLLLLKANQWLGENLGSIAGDVRARHIKDGILLLESRTSVATQEAHGLSPDLIAHLRREVPKLLIAHVKIRRSR